ncbi:MAG: BON domain-containing protein [Burkholderiales bacterium]|nr:BON domain-containing protein [Burkholderiales bacterium]
MKKLVLILSLSSAFVTLPTLAYADVKSETVGEYTNTSAITTSVKTKLAGTKGVDSADISVRTETDKDGKAVVYLSGTQKTKQQIKDAIDSAKMVDGVNKVVNNLVVR